MVRPRRVAVSAGDTGLRSFQAASYDRTRTGDGDPSLEGDVVPLPLVKEEKRGRREDSRPETTSSCCPDSPTSFPLSGLSMALGGGPMWGGLVVSKTAFVHGALSRIVRSSPLHINRRKVQVIYVPMMDIVKIRPLHPPLACLVA